MKRSIIAALAGIAVVATVSVAAARLAEDPTDPANCGLNDRQAAAGWTCTEEITNFSTMPTAARCQDWQTTTYRAYNPAEKFVEEKSSSETVAVGGQYSSTGGCNYPVQ